MSTENTEVISEWRYRTVALVGGAGLIASAVLVANHPAIQSLSMVVPVYSQLEATTLAGESLLIAVATVLVVASVALTPLYKPRPRRVFDTIVLAERRVLVLTFALATVGYFDYTYRLPRTTLVLTATLLAVLLPAWFVALRRLLRNGEVRAIIVGDDVGRFSTIMAQAEHSVVGYVSPTVSSEGRDGGSEVPQVADGGSALIVDPPRLALDRLGGLSRLDDTLIDYDADVAILAFSRPDRQEFFGTLSTCHQHGVTAKIPRDHVESVLSRDGVDSGGLVTIDLEPWDWQDIAVKRAFDVVFATVGLVVLAPIMLALAVAIKADDGGPVFYSQRRTASFGGTYPVYKFRTMVPESEDETPVDDEENGHITRVGRVLRRTHLDEIPQLLAILTGEMSVVGPRAAWIDEESLLAAETAAWRKRWFVKPGLTGLAQVNDFTSTEPEAKLRYDVAYIRHQSFRFDLRIVARQVIQVAADVVEIVARVRNR